MHHLTRRGLTLLPLLSMRPWPAQAQADAQPGAALLAALMARLAAIPARRASFRETRSFGALTQTLESAGHLAYRRPAYLEKVTDWPQPERLVVDGDRLVLTEAAEAPRVIDLGAVPELRALVDALRGPLSGDLAALRRSFTVVATGTLSAWAMELTPVDPRAAKLLRRVRLAGAGDEIREIVLSQANGDEQRMAIGPST